METRNELAVTVTAVVAAVVATAAPAAAVAVVTVLVIARRAWVGSRGAWSVFPVQFPAISFHFDAERLGLSGRRFKTEAESAVSNGSFTALLRGRYRDFYVVGVGPSIVELVPRSRDIEAGVV
uniref:Uncharacterized protein n=1 Tax=Vespula pensylvanica TaxID=30213 RepID=A0A834PB49_VESPE|nr:hypothetical protein H0235_002924 [Vespula pensylvanica]